MSALLYSRHVTHSLHVFFFNSPLKPSEDLCCCFHFNHERTESGERQGQGFELYLFRSLGPPGRGREGELQWGVG